MTVAAWVPDTLKKQYFKTLETPEKFDPALVDVTKKLVLNKKLGKQWKTLRVGFDTDEDTIGWLRLNIVFALSIAETDKMTKSDKERKAEKLIALTKQISPLLQEFDWDFDIYSFLPIEAQKKILLGMGFQKDAVENGEINSAMIDFNLEIAEAPKISNILTVIAQSASMQCGGTMNATILPSPNSVNYKEIYFIRMMYTSIHYKFKRPMISLIEILIDTFFPDNELSGTYVKDCVERFKKRNT